MTRSAHKVAFIREKGKAATRDRQGAGKSVAPCGLYRCFFVLVWFFWSFLLGKGVRSQGWSGLLTYLCRNIYTVLQKPTVFEAFPEGHDL
jgi:hypothetical protein